VGKLQENPFPVGDPRRQTWEMLAAFVQTEEHAAKAELLKSGAVDDTSQSLNHFARFAVRILDAGMKALAISVTDTNSAQERSSQIDEMVSRYFLEWRRSSFPLIARQMRLTEQEVESEVRMIVLPRVEHWKSVAFQFALRASLKGTTSTGDKSSETNGSRHERVESFLTKVEATTGRKIVRADLWRTAGYIDATQFERYQRGERATQTASANFERILAMEPDDFIQEMDRKQKRR
jgi:hypothetical protein